MNGILSAWTWVEIVVVGGGSFLVQLPLALVTLPFDRGRRVVGRTLRLAGVLSSKLTPFWQFGVHGEVHRPAGKTVVVSNHESNADPFLISYLPWEMKWLSKASLFKVPFIGWGMWLAGDIPLRRGEAESGRAAMVKAARWLQRGVPVMIFPEGTRSRDGALLPFKDGAFRLAIEQGADVLPIAVSGTKHALPKHSWRFGVSRARVTTGKPISTLGMTLADLPALKERVREEIVRMREELLPLTSGTAGT